MSGEELETVVDIDGVIIGFVSSQDEDVQDVLSVYDANYDFIGPARSLKIAEQLLRQHRADASIPAPRQQDRRFTHSFR